MDLIKDERKFQLLEGRLNAGSESVKQSPASVSESNLKEEENNAPEKPPTEGFLSPQSAELIVIDSNSGANTRSNLSNKSQSGSRVGSKRQWDSEMNEPLRHRSPKFKKQEESENSPNGETGSRGAGGTMRSITSYFSTAAANTYEATGTTQSHHSLYQTSTNDPSLASTSGEIKVTQTATNHVISAPRSAGNLYSGGTGRGSSVNQQLNELKKQFDTTKYAKEQGDIKLLRMEGELSEAQEQHKILEDRNAKVIKLLEEMYRKTAFQEFRRKRDKLALDCVRLGKIVSVRTGPTTMGEVWEEGYALRDLNKRSAGLLERKEELEARKRRAQTMKRAAKKGAGITTSTDENTIEEQQQLDIDFELISEMEVLRAHMDQLKRDEIGLAEERRLLESEKAVHQKELKRCQCEERSRFYRDLPTLNKRYLLQSMIGRGGFSEVWKALDLIELKEVAVKIHQLNPTWNEERKQSYIKHVTREYTIHRDMRHPRVVQLFDVFEIDVNSFATVLEYCRGIDLDEKLKRQRTIPEKDARAVLMQIMSGLKYLNRPFIYKNEKNEKNEENGNDNKNGNKKLSIIHFDLKPANILFDEVGDVKITDFGLSKIIDESHEGTSMELTSQGAGTYWYLPPECFHKGSEPARISSKVDVWSTGIIFYQMLYGCRPFGEGKSQENVWSEGIIYNASQVQFPTDPKSPKVSEEAKELIRACLTKDQKLRPDILTLCRNPYLKNK